MQNYFQCTVKFDKLQDDGLSKTSTEHYLVEAINHAEAENRITAEMKAFTNGELMVESVKKQKIAEIFGADNAEGDRWYKAKVVFVTLDEEKSVEKRRAVSMLVKSDTPEHALKTVRGELSIKMSDYEIAAITETPLMDFFPYAEPQPSGAFWDEKEDENEN